MSAELFDALKQLINIQRILPKQTPFQHHGIGGTGSIPHFAIPYNIAVGINFQKDHVFG